MANNLHTSENRYIANGPLRRRVFIALTRLAIAAARLFENFFRPRRIEYPARTETRKIITGLFGGAAAFLDPVNHLPREIERDHAVTAHRGEFHYLPVGQPVGLAHETERVLDTVAGDAYAVAAFLRAVNQGADVDRKAKVFLL